VRVYLTHCRAMQSHAKGPPISPDARLMETCAQINPWLRVDGVEGMIHASRFDSCTDRETMDA